MPTPELLPHAPTPVRAHTARKATLPLQPATRPYRPFPASNRRPGLPLAGIGGKPIEEPLLDDFQRSDRGINAQRAIPLEELLDVLFEERRFIWLVRAHGFGLQAAAESVS